MGKQPTLGSLRLFWAQQLLTLVLLGAAVHIQNGDAATRPDALDDHGLVLTGLAVILVVIGLVLRIRKAGAHALPFLVHRADTVWGQALRLDQKDSIKSEALYLYKTATILGTACAELAVLCGCALALTSKMTALYWPFAGVCGAVILWQLPNRQSLDAICRALEQKKRSV